MDNLHGFQWDNVKVKRVAGGGDKPKCIVITTNQGQQLEIIISPAGYSIRAILNGKELLPLK